MDSSLGSLDIIFIFPAFNLSPMVLAMPFNLTLLCCILDLGVFELLSSANSKSSNLVQSVHLMPVRCCFVRFFINQSMITMIKKADIAHDWRTLEFTTNLKLELCMSRLTLL